VRLRVGGKFDAYHGEPVEIDAYIRLLSDGKYTHYGSYMTGLRVSMGRTAVVSCDDVEIVLMEEKAMPFDAQQLRSVGIEPSRRRILVVKSAQAWKAAYGDLARRVFYVDTPGLCSSNLTLFPYRNIRRPMYPLNEDTRL
jgi:microcystin degradation protein MlrC